MRNAGGTRILTGILIVILGAASAFAQPRYGGKRGWYKGNSHIHTNRAGADLTPSAAAKWYHDNDYDFIVLTEHRIFLGPGDAVFTPRRQGFLIIAGEEFNSLNAYGNNHTTVINASGALGDIAAGSSSKWEFFNRVYALATSKGGFPLMNHPTWASLVSVDDFSKITGFRHFELFNGCADTDSYGIFGAGMPPIEAHWDSILTRGLKFYGTGSDDMHQFTARPGTCNPMSGWTMLKAASLSVENVLDAYRKGRIYVTNGVMLADLRDSLGLYTVIVDTASTRLELARRDSARFVNSARPVASGTPGYRIDFIGPRGQVLKSVTGDSARYQVTNAHAYVRARVTYLRNIPARGAPYDNHLKQADYVRDKGITKEEYYAWGQPFFTDARREGPALVFGCTNTGFLEYDPKANVMDTSKCVNRTVTIHRGTGPELQAGGAAGAGSFTLSVAPEMGDYTVEVRTLSGKSVRTLRPNASRRHVLAGLVRFGTYLVAIKGARRTVVKKITVP